MTLYFAVAGRERLETLLLGRPERDTLVKEDALRRLKTRQVAIAYAAHHPSQPPILILTADDELRDLLAWITTYMPSIRPLTSACRVMGISEWFSFRDVGGDRGKMALISPWCGVVLAECYSQVYNAANFRRMPLAAAFSCLSFSIARLTYLWSQHDRFSDLVAGVTRDHRRLLPKRRTMEPSVLVPVWSSLWALQHIGPFSQPDSVSAAIVDTLYGVRQGMPISRALRKHMLPYGADQLWEIVDDSLSPEQKIRGFDRLLENLGSSQNKFVNDFLVGAAASNISSGGLAHIDLAAQSATRFPGAILWYGLLAGLSKDLHWSGEFDGMARNIGKAAVRTFDWDNMPECDLAMSELVLDETLEGSFDLSRLRSISNRFHEIELVPGVNAVVPASDMAVSNTQLRVPTQQHLAIETNKASSNTSISDVMRLLANIETQTQEARRLLSPTSSPSGDASGEVARIRRRKRLT